MNSITQSSSKILLALLGALLSLQTSAADWSYSVRPADTLWHICKTYTDRPSCWADIQVYNKIQDPTKLSIGDKVLVPVQWLKKAPSAATVSYVNGEAFVVEVDADRPLKASDKLVVGAEIYTLQGGVTLTFADGSTLVLGKNSRLLIDAVSAFSQTLGGSVEVSLPNGEVTVQVPVTQPRLRFNVRTPSAVAAVRGTKFRVASDAETTGSKSEVLEGVVGFGGDQNEVVLEKGFASKVAQVGAELLPPVALLSAPEWNRSCNDPGYAAWSEPAGATQYKLVLLENDTQLDKVISEVMVASSEYTFTDIDDGCYQLRVSAIDDNGFNGNETQREFCYTAPELEMPVVDAGSLRNDKLFVDWGDVRYASAYVVELSDDQAFVNLLSTHTVDNSEMTLSLAPSVNPVYVRVKAVAGSQIVSEQSKVAEYRRERSYGWLVATLAALLAFAAL